WVAIQFKLPRIQNQLQSQLYLSMGRATSEINGHVRKVATEVASIVAGAREQSFADLHCPSDRLHTVKQVSDRIQSIAAPQFPIARVDLILGGKYQFGDGVA